jgi:hypothetical protein
VRLFRRKESTPERNLAFKVLKKNVNSGGLFGPWSGERWPRDRWVKVRGDLHPCVRGIHACMADDVNIWVRTARNSGLIMNGRTVVWLIELSGEIYGDTAHMRASKIVARKGRLVRPLSIQYGDRTDAILSLLTPEEGQKLWTPSSAEASKWWL